MNGLICQVKAGRQLTLNVQKAAVAGNPDAIKTIQALYFKPMAYIETSSNKDGLAMIQFSIPGLTLRLPFNMLFCNLMRTAPELFFDDVRINSMYGCFPDCIMNGGRIVYGKRYTYDQIAETFDRINEAGMIVRLTLTNMFICPEQFEDEYCQTILKAAQGRNVEAIVYSHELGDYISSQFHLKKTLSTTRALSGVEELNEMLDRYNMVVLNFNHNKDDDFLKQVKDPARLEVMPNELCEPGCPIRQKHYEHNSRCQLSHEFTPFGCNRQHESSGYSTRTDQSPTILGNKDIRRLNTIYGISNFKIVGRILYVRLSLEPYIYYFVRQEYHTLVSKIIKKNLESSPSLSALSFNQ